MRKKRHDKNKTYIVLFLIFILIILLLSLSELIKKPTPEISKEIQEIEKVQQQSLIIIEDGEEIGMERGEEKKENFKLSCSILLTGSSTRCGV